ncbi:hypothetical protein [Qipengyuania sp.]|uniref:hypothetical protein n=1 Tax=Qipengyuania sp. TaxID=2004515 RepID=UPI0037367C88
MSRTSRLAVLAGAGMLAGCTTTAVSFPPSLTYAPATCADGVDTVSALSLVPDKDKAIWTRDDQVSAASACIRRGGAAVPYLVYALPPAGSARMVEVGAVLEPTRVVSPEVVLLDEAGNETRSFARESYMFRPGLYSVQFVPAANERFALVMVDPAPIGKTHDTITLGTSSTMVYTGFGVSNWTAGNEAMMSRGFSYEGTMRALVYRAQAD